MGSYCISCVASGQVISDRARCVMLPILQSHSYNPVKTPLGESVQEHYGPSKYTTHPGSFWHPFSTFVTGTYVDRGRMQPDDTFINRQALLHLFQELVYTSPVAEGGDSSKDTPFDFLAFLQDKAPGLARVLRDHNRKDIPLEALSFEEIETAWEYLFDGIDDNRVFASRFQGPLRSLQFAAFHGAAFDHLVDMGLASKSLRGNNWALEDLLPRVFDELKEQFKKFDSPPEYSEYFFQSQLLDSLKLGLSIDVHEVRYPFNIMQQEVLLQYVKGTLPLGKVVETLMPTMTGVYALKAMDDLNLRLAPASYAGDDYHNENGRAYVKFVSAVSKEVTKAAKALYR